MILEIRFQGDDELQYYKLDCKRIRDMDDLRDFMETQAYLGVTEIFYIKWNSDGKIAEFQPALDVLINIDAIVSVGEVQLQPSI